MLFDLLLPLVAGIWAAFVGLLLLDQIFTGEELRLNVLREKLRILFNNFHDLLVEHGVPGVSPRKHPRPHLRGASTFPARLDEEQDGPGAQIFAKDEADWLDSLLEVLWPRISIYLEQKVRNEIQPSITAALPSYLKRSVVFQEVTLGTVTPDFGPLVVRKNDDDGSIELNLGIRMDTNMSIGLTAMGVYVGVSKFRMSGALTVIYGPPLERPPFFGGMQIFFADMPDIDLDFRGVARIADCPGVRGLVRSTISQAVGDALVLPQRIAVDLNPDDAVDHIDLKYPDPWAVLRFSLREGSDLVAADFSLFGQRSSDPYVIMTLGCKTWTSPVIKQSLNPVWQKQDGNSPTVDFLVHSSKQHARIEVFDEDFASSDDLIGVATYVPIHELTEDVSGRKASSVRIPLTLMVRGRESPAGSLRVSARLLRLSAEQPLALFPEPSVAYLHAKLEEVTDLLVDARCPCHPFKVRVSLLGSQGTSKASWAKATPAASEALQGMCSRLAAQDFQTSQIAGIMGITREQVASLLLQPSIARDGTLKQAVLEQKEKRASENPQFGEVLQMLISAKSFDEVISSSVELELIDSKSKVIGALKVKVEDIIAAERSPSSSLPDRFDLGLPGAAQLKASFKLRWLTEAEDKPPSIDGKTSGLHRRASMPAGSWC